MAYQARPGEWGGRPRQAQQGQVVALPTADQIGTLAIRGIKTFATKNKVISFSWVWGIVVLLLVGGGTKLTVDQARRYNHIMSTIDLDAEFAASNQYAVAMQNYRATKGWLSCDSLCQRNKANMERARVQLEDIRAEGQARMSDAKRVAGLFSEVGVGEVKDSFWEYFAAGKVRYDIAEESVGDTEMRNGTMKMMKKEILLGQALFYVPWYFNYCDARLMALHSCCR